MSGRRVALLGVIYASLVSAAIAVLALSLAVPAVLSVIRSQRLHFVNGYRGCQVGLPSPSCDKRYVCCCLLEFGFAL